MSEHSGRANFGDYIPLIAFIVINTGVTIFFLVGAISVRAGGGS